LPKVIRTVGQWVGKARSMAREFQSSLDDIAREAELDELKQQIDKAGTDFEKAARDTAEQADFGKELENTIDPSGTLDNMFETPAEAADAESDSPAVAAKTDTADAPSPSPAAAEEPEPEETKPAAAAAPRTGT
jgi:sec-independent protein translocase protein TatB